MIEAYLDKGCRVHYIAVEPYPFEHENLIPHIMATPMKSRESLVFWIYFFSLAPWHLLWVGLKHRIELISVGSPHIRMPFRNRKMDHPRSSGHFHFYHPQLGSQMAVQLQSL